MTRKGYYLNYNTHKSTTTVSIDSFMSTHPHTVICIFPGVINVITIYFMNECMLLFRVEEELVLFWGQ